MRTCALLALMLAAAAVPAAARDPLTVPLPLLSLAILRSPSNESIANATSCLGVMIGGGALLAQAHCVAQLDAAHVVAEFGMFSFPDDPTAPLNPDLPMNNGDGAPAEQRVPVTSIAFDPGFQRTLNASDKAFVASDFATLRLPDDFFWGQNAYLLNNTVRFVKDGGIQYPNFGVLQVDPESLATRWLVGDVTIAMGEACGFAADSVAARDTICAHTPRLWTGPYANLAAGAAVLSPPSSSNSTVRRKPWVLLFHTDEYGFSDRHFLGFATGVDAAVASQSLQAFVWPWTAIDFLMSTVADAWWTKNGQYETVVPGPELSWLPLHLSFVAGLRTEQEGANFCGGSLISPTFVLTAAHCVEGEDAPVFVSVGSLKTSGTLEGEQIRVQRTITHPQYDRASRANDLALVELKYPSAQVPVMLLDSPRFVPRAATIFGYGAMDANSDGPVPSDRLRYLNLNVIARNAECEKLLQQPVDDSMFCAGGAPSKDACVGDSGGPLIAESLVENDVVALAGVVSYGRGECGASNSPGVYTNVTKAYPFIRQYVPEVAWTSNMMVDPFPPLMDLGMGVGAPPDSPEPTSPTSSSTATPSTSRPPVNLGTSRPTKPPSGLPPKSSTGDVSTGVKFELPADLSPSVKDAFVNFLIGGTDQIDSNRVRDRFQQASIVLQSTQSLDNISHVLKKFSAMLLHQRVARFARSTSALAQC